MATINAYIITDTDITDEDLNTAVLSGVNQFCALDNIVRVETLPRNDSGKVVPRLLPEIPGSTR